MAGGGLASKKRKATRYRGVIAAVGVCAVILVGVGLAFGPFGGNASLPDAQSAAVQETGADTSEVPAASSDVADEAVESAPSSELPMYEQDSILVSLRSWADADAVTSQLSTFDFLDSPVVTEEDVDAGFVQLRLASGCSVESSVDQIKDIEGVAGSQPNFLYYLDDTAVSESQSLVAGTELVSDTKLNDPKAKKQWHLNKKQGINAYQAWDLMKGQKAKKRVAVAVLDTGCNYRHKDLKNNIVAKHDATGSYNSGTDDIQGHGTHVCGIVAAQSGNKKGVSGVSYNANVLPVQVFHRSGSSMGADTASLLRAYKYVTKNTYKYNIRVVNMSLGGYRSSSTPYYSDDEAMVKAIEKAYKAGILTVCSAGNDADSYGAYYQFPSSYLKHGMSVIALNKNHTRTYWSNYNHYGEKRMDISAPGVSILSTYYNGKYYRMDGTSQASPIVAGTAALVFSANQSLSPSKVIKVLHKTAKDIGSSGFDVYTGYGEVNAYNALKYVKKKYGFKTSSRSRRGGGGGGGGGGGLTF